MPNPLAKKVKSSNVESVHYDPETKTLEVNFKSGGTYHYHGVTQEACDALDSAESVGKHINSHIKGKHTWVKQ